MTKLKTVPLHEVAHSRTGDKGNRLNASLIVYNKAAYAYIRDQISAQRVAELFAARGCVSVRRYELPLLGALNFVLDDVLEGGVNGSLNLDGHGKTLSFLLLTLTVEMPQGLLIERATGGVDSPFAENPQTPVQVG
jgi:hypothetical protein